MKKIIITLTLVLFTTLAFADTLPSKEKAKELAQNVMAEIGKGNMEAGVKLTKPYLIVPEHEYFALIDQMKMQQPIIEQRFGKTISVEIAEIEEVGESLMLVLYLQKFDKHVLRWKFYFYKPRNEWVLNTFMFDDQIHAMFSIM
ncbi:hypothetical protein J7384_16875 [Endozoicomonas sp. G2_1]|uniref:hypothetical protein n=1 Tax=Endozoicomonas sp. G2_1 TaxID=2821091 RepID=UPI001ADCD762|nr:hypothetical protein [Endozoicomonas sp. G2_1]MBO9492037.1 hypothetical protein [Endozoicomonas sp. G2_1]